ncbi:MAG TPA: NifU family protein [Luteibaculaceae bacterium]|jgi:Fe-S cluster biogenesis protein NfuA|nr:NifU family protein [Luteibaculaceae bacterium]
MNTELRSRVEEALNQIRPFLADDGGDISLVDISDDMIAQVMLHGSCSSCSMSMMTLKAGVEDSIKRAVPEIKGVEAVNLPDPATATPFGR